MNQDDFEENVTNEIISSDGFYKTSRSLLRLIDRGFLDLRWIRVFIFELKLLNYPVKNWLVFFHLKDDEYKEEDADIEVAIPITGRITLDSDEYEVKNLHGHDMVSLIYTGSYEDVGVAYTKAFKYINENNFAVVDHSREIYLNDPNTVNEEELMTEIQIPIRKEA